MEELYTDQFIITITFVGSFLLALMVAFFIIPVIIRKAQDLKLMDVPGHRASHTVPTPSLGGLGIFAGLLIATVFLSLYAELNIFLMILVCLVTLVVMGVFDDRLDLSARFKFLIQFLVAGYVAYTGIRIETLYGLFGIYELPLILQYTFTILTIVLVTNAFNLIDGINGLAGGLGLINSFIFAGLFIYFQDIGFAIFALAWAGGLIAFLYFNFPKGKIFLGDTGSLPLGFFMAVFGLRVISQHMHFHDPGVAIADSFILVFAMLMIPVLDTLRVFTIRIWRKTSPFVADKNHIHHLLLKNGLDHTKATLTLYGVNQVYVTIAFLVASNNINWALSILMLSWVVMAEGLTILKYLRHKSREKGALKATYELTKKNILLARHRTKSMNAKIK